MTNYADGNEENKEHRLKCMIKSHANQLYTHIMNKEKLMSNMMISGKEKKVYNIS